MVTRSAPGLLLGIFVIAGTVAAALAVRPTAGRMILPVPALSYLAAAMISGIVFNREAATSNAALAIGAAQWVADGFFSMVLATALAIAITAARWFLWRRSRPVARDRDWAVPASSPARPGLGTAAPAPVSAMAPAATAGTGPAATERISAPRRTQPTAWENDAAGRNSGSRRASAAGPSGAAGLGGSPRMSGAPGSGGASRGRRAAGDDRAGGGSAAGGPTAGRSGLTADSRGPAGGSRSAETWDDSGRRGDGQTDRRARPRPGSSPYLPDHYERRRA